MIRWLPGLAALVVLLGGVLVHAGAPAPLVAMRNALFDAYQDWSPRQPGDFQVLIVDIDEDSLERVGQWPWPRHLVAQVVERLQQAGAAAIGLDIVFAEADRYSPREVLAMWNRFPAVRRVLSKLPDTDDVFSGVLANGGVVTGFAFTERRTAAEKEPVLPAKKASIAIQGLDPLPFIPVYDAASPSLPKLQDAADGNGALNFLPDQDGLVRRAHLLFRMNDQVYPTLGIEVLRVALGTKLLTLNGSDGEEEESFGSNVGLNGIRIGSRRNGLPVATDGSGAVWLHHARFDRSRYLSAWRLLGEEPTDLPDLTGRVVLLGTSAEGLKDLRHAPVNTLVPGVEIHAQLIEQAVDGSYLARPNWANGAEILYLVLCGLLLTVLIYRVKTVYVALAFGILVLLTGAGSLWLFTARSLLLDPVFPSAALLVMFIAASVPRQIQVERERRMIRDAFSSYVSPNLVQHLISDPEAMTLGGERRECSFVFTDLAGFTSMVEKSDPTEVMTILNEYLDRMVGIAFEHDGMLDNIIGDAVAVIFSAPLLQEDHARRAIDCAFAMDRFAESFRARKNAEGLPLGITRIGVNTGTVIVGNVGGENFFDYRALGDPINTAARLETANRHLGTRMCVAASTVAAVPAFRGRLIGDLIVKGKSEPLTVYEPTDGDTAAYEAAFALLEAGDPEALAAFEKLAGENPEDGLVAMHRDRLRRGESGRLIVLQEK